MNAQLPKRKRLAVAIASGLAGPALLAGCAEEKVDAAIFADVPQCIAAGQDAMACEEAFQAAGQEHAAAAPRFTGLADCEAEFGAGACADAATAGVTDENTQHAGGGFFYPLMAGYLMGSALGRMNQPLYRSTNGTWRNPAGSNLGTRTGAVSVARSAATPSSGARTTVTSRGGFATPRASRGFGG